MNPEDRDPEGKVIWIECPGCDGEVGVPRDRLGEVICCPNCAAKFKTQNGEIVFWRPKRTSPSDLESQAVPTLSRNNDPAPSDNAAEHRLVEQPPQSTAEIHENTTRANSPKKLPVASTFDGPGWMQPIGMAFIALGATAAVASGMVGGGGDFGGFLIAAALNPLFFVGVPLGIYWCLAGRANRGYYCPHCQHKIRWNEPVAVIAKPGAHVTCKICKAAYICPPLPPDVFSSHSVSEGIQK